MSEDRMIEHAMDSEGPIVAWYLVAFIDVLGQQNVLREMAALPNERDLDQMRDFGRRLQATAGKVLRLRQMFDKFFERASQKRDLSDLSPEHGRLYRTFTSSPLKSHRFSDCVVFSLCLCDDVNRVPMLGVYSILYAAAATFANMLADGTALRGAIEVGLGLELPEGDIYGPALARAHNLESLVAQYPRLLIGDELHRYIELQRQADVNDEYDALNRALAEQCTQLLAVDDDGHLFLDYLGRGLPLASDTTGEPIVRKAYEFVVDQSRRHQEAKDSKLAFRYGLLRDYFEHRLGPERIEAWLR